MESICRSLYVSYCSLYDSISCFVKELKVLSIPDGLVVGVTHEFAEVTVPSTVLGVEVRKVAPWFQQQQYHGAMEITRLIIV